MDYQYPYSPSAIVSSSSTPLTLKKHVPTPFNRLASYPKDLFKKNFEFQHSLKTVTHNRSGLSLTSGATLQDNGEVRGFVKTTLPRFSFGTVSAELNTDATQDSKVSIDFVGLPAGLTITPTISSKDKSFQRPLGGLEIGYKHEYISTSVAAKSDLENHTVDATLSVGDAGYTAGASVALDINNGADVKEYNFGFEYEQDDYTATFCTENNHSTVTASYFQRLTPLHKLGAQFKYSVNTPGARSLTVGSEYRVSAVTTLKTKVDVPSGDIATYVEHQLANPPILVGLATSFNIRSKSVSADKVGINVTLGDY